MVWIIKLLEVLVVPKLNEQGEQYMQTFNYAFVALTLVDGDVGHRADEACVV